MSVRTEAVGRLTLHSEREAVSVATVPAVTDTSEAETVETEHKDMCPPGSLDWKHQLRDRWREISGDDAPTADDSDTTGDDTEGNR